MTIINYLRNHPDSIIGAVYKTPDNNSGSQYTIIENNQQILKIETKNGSILSIPWNKFQKVIDVLIQHGFGNFVEIGSNNQATERSSLSLEVEPRGTRHINYILPILEKIGFVEIDGNRPNKVKLI